MSRLSIVFCVAAAAALTSTAFGDAIDPAMFQDGSHCSGTYWCASTGLAVDPVTGFTTLEFVLKTSVSTSQGITPFTTTGSTGWVAAKNGSTVNDLLDFEYINNTDVIFLYCGDGSCSSDDLGMPTGITPAATFTDGTTYTPGSGKPGFADSYNPAGTLSNPTGYAIIDVSTLSGVGHAPTATPEPSSVLLLGGILLITARAFRRYPRRGYPGA